MRMFERFQDMNSKHETPGTIKYSVPLTFQMRHKIRQYSKHNATKNSTQPMQQHNNSERNTYTKNLVHINIFRYIQIKQIQ